MHHRTVVRVVYPALIVALVAAVFAGVPQLGWVDFDDTVNVTENPRFFPVSWSGLTAFWLRPYENLYIPLSYMVYGLEAVIDRWLAGADPAGPLRPQVFHVVSLSMHAFTAVLVWEVLRLSGFAPLAAGAGAAAFATHPLQVESVAWVSEQRGLLSAACSLLAIRDAILGHRFENRKSRGHFVVGTIWFCLALLAKPSAVTVPVITWLMVTTTAAPTRRLNTWMAAWLCMGAVTTMVTRWVQPHGLPPEWISPSARVLVVADALWFYVGKLILPTGLCATYGRTPADVLTDPAAPWRAVAAYGAIATVVCLPWAQLLRRPILLFVVPLLPVIGLIPFVYQNQSVVADRYAYLPLVGVAWSVAGVIGGMVRFAKGEHVTPWLRGAVVPAAIAGLAVMAFLSYRQVACWRDTGTLARQAVMVNPANVAGWTMLATYELGQGSPVEAAAHARRALARAPRNAVALFTLFEACARLGDDEGAQAALGKLEQIGYPHDRMAEVFFFRGVSHVASDRLEKARDNFRLAVSLNPGHAWATINLGVVLTRLTRPQEAIDILTSYTNANPQRAAAWVGLGNAFLAAGKAEKAVECYTRSLEIEADDPAVFANRAIAREQSGDIVGSREDRRRAAGNPQ